MKEIISPTGYKVIKLTRLEIAAINQLVCHNCYKNKVSKHPKNKDIETIRFENDNYDKVLTQLEKAQCFNISMFMSLL